MSRAFEVVRDITLPAAPDDVWTAITSDTAAWQFPDPTESLAAGANPGPDSPITVWEPPHRLVIRMESPDGMVNSLEYVIEARDGGTAHVHYVHSGILSDEWESEYDAVGPHTDFYLHTLGEYLAHFNGRPVTYIGQPTSGIEGPAASATPDAMDTLRSALGLTADVAVGDPVDAPFGDAGTLEGVVDYATPEFLGVRTEDGLFRFFGRNHFGSVVGMSGHLFRDDVDPVVSEAACKAWLDSVYA